MVMRWSYKTVLYELKKEGLLGSAFLDESEIEQSLNEFGATGWELISMLETREGIIAVFKQPLGGVAASPPLEDREEDTVMVTVNPPSAPPLREPEPVGRQKEPIIRAQVRPEEEIEPISGIGSIRIE